MVAFVGREAELAALDKRMRRVTTQGTGSAVALRGRRQVGKSRLVQEFCDRSGAPYLFFTATKGASAVESVATFCAELKDSTLVGDPDLIPILESGNWPDAFRLLASALPQQPSIVVLDEVPWLTEQDPVFDGALQTAWDRLIARHPVVLLLLGSDLHMMERLTAYDRPFYGRADNMVLGPLNPAETAQALALAAADALDAHLISGGLPGIIRGWPRAMPAEEFIRMECEDPASPVFSVPESTLLAEFPSPDHSRRLLEAVGSGNRTQANIAASAGGTDPLPSGVISPLLRRLATEKRMIAVEEPLSTRPGKPALYRIGDSNLRLYFAVLRSLHEHSRRGRPDLAYQTFQRRWSSVRGRAIEPLIRSALELAAAAGATPWPQAHVVGGWWNRGFATEVDLVGADRGPVASRLYFTGSIKWLTSPFDSHDLADLLAGSAQVPGSASGRTGTMVVSRSGVAPQVTGVDLVWGPQDVVSAYR